MDVVTRRRKPSERYVKLDGVRDIVSRVLEE